MLGERRRTGSAGVDPYLSLDCPFSDVRFAPPYRSLNVDERLPESGHASHAASAAGVRWHRASITARSKLANHRAKPGVGGLDR